MNSAWSAEDIKELNERGISVQEADAQLQRLRNGFSSPDIIAPATVGNGIALLSDELEKQFISLFESRKDFLQLCKFVPASGAASRMFVHLHSIVQGKFDDSGKEFIHHLKDFPFWPKLENLAQKQDVTDESYWSKLLLDEKGLGYGNIPKGLVDFHMYPQGARTAFQEQLHELPYYAVSAKTSQIHFTVAQEFIEQIRIHLINTIADIEEKSGIEINFELSTQTPASDTLAGTSEGLPFRDKSGKLVFRPGGHGALLKNLANVNADLVFIKNIDNVVPDGAKADVLRYKSVLAGYLLHLADKIKQTAEMLRAGATVANSAARKLLENELGFQSTSSLSDEELLLLLARPLRVCGMVRNEGEPGGGPFWVKDARGNVTLQIVEKAQIDLSNSRQAALLAESTHFNPVDIVAMPGGALNSALDLAQYTDPEMGFMSAKTFEGKPLLALEHPGLWNGAMANWNTAFVEVPLFTFNPVKTVNDLLRPIHRFAKVTF